ncbi:hypothetical protein RchiOBHm_Chr6g0299511 [Rosa chinensis]|uniref:Transmembrane protein n=1 Tax=Rosa chinensis TaxID=74649 RepID=A0A2P6PY96_ROSCH|nr:hypothetical protein RchiOBHm_Chr6g0299511 [Rosa chinensis]
MLFNFIAHYASNKSLPIWVRAYGLGFWFVVLAGVLVVLGISCWVGCTASCGRDNILFGLLEGRSYSGVGSAVMAKKSSHGIDNHPWPSSGSFLSGFESEAMAIWNISGLTVLTLGWWTLGGELVLTKFSIKDPLLLRMLSLPYS